MFVWSLSELVVNFVSSQLAKGRKLGHLLGLGSCAANGFRICVYLRSSAVPYFRNGSLMLKYRLRELNNCSNINMWRRRVLNYNPKQHIFNLTNQNNFKINMQITALYEKDVLKPLKKLDLKEKTRVRITIRDSFYKLLQELGEIEAKESIDNVMENIRTKKYYG
jgi:predicted DNA-binding antitoxin AbrB/MazE fold protein